MIPDSAYVHILVPVQLSQFQDLFIEAKKLLDKNTQDTLRSRAFEDKKYYDWNIEGAHELFIRPKNNGGEADITGISAYHRIEEMLTQFQNITALLPQSENPEQDIQKIRTKRVASLVIAGIFLAGLLGTFLGLYSQTQLGSITTVKDLDLLLHIEEEHQDMIANLNKRVNSAFKMFSDQNKADANNRANIWQGIIDQLQHKLDKFVQFVTELQRHRLSMTWFTPHQMNILHQEVNTQAQKHGLSPLPQYLSDYFQLEVSYIKSATEIIAIIHVPVSATKSTWTIFKYIPFPIPANNGNILTIHADQDIIAVGPDHHHKILSQSQFDACIRRNHHYICESPLVTNKNFSTSCVGSLMDHNQLGIEQHCSLQNRPMQEMVFQTSSNQFAIFSPDTYTGRGQCNNGTAISALIAQTSTITIPNGCNFMLKQHVITTPINIISSLTPWVQETKWDVLSVPRRLLDIDNKRRIAINQILINDSSTELITQAQLEAAANDLKDAHMTIKAQLDAAKQMHSYALFAVAGCVVLLTLLICLCLCVRFQRRQPIQAFHFPMEQQ